MLTFEILNRASTSHARRGRIRTSHGLIETPVFMPVGTAASVKSLDARDLEELGPEVILGNTYHLMLRPGSELIGRFGGLHRFMAYTGSILTDSGGFQVFSLEGLRKLTEQGVQFRSHIDGALFDLSPERAVAIQEELGSDIAMQLDECPPGQAPKEDVAVAMQRSLRWAARCIAARRRPEQALFGIVQGGTHLDLRAESAEKLSAMPFDGLAIGGVSVGEAPAEIERVVAHCAPLLPEHKPRYLMGVGTPADLVRGVAAGVDMFDCVMPTRNARNGMFFTSQGKLAIKNVVHRESDLPIDAACPCLTCRTYSRGYLRHLYTAHEISYYRLATLHNLTYYLGLMRDIRADLARAAFDVATYLARVHA